MHEALIKSEREAWSNFFGRRQLIPKPPELLFETLSTAQKDGIEIYEPHFLPKHQFRRNDEFPGWKYKPSNIFWELISMGLLSPDVANLGGYWVLFDKTPKSDFKNNGNQLYPNDSLGPTLARLRQERKLYTYEFRKGFYPETTRYWIPPKEIFEKISPEIANILKVDPDMSRLPTALETNILANIFYKEFGNTDTWEWFQDRIKSSEPLVGGGKNEGGITHIAKGHSYVIGENYIGFRSMIIFPRRARKLHLPLAA